MKPLSSRNTKYALNRRAFFNGSPLLALPMFNRFLIAFYRTPLGLLTTPAALRQEPAHVGAVVPDPELFLDHGGHARAGPQVGAVSVRLRTAQQHLRQPLALSCIEFRRSAGHGLRLQARLPSVSFVLAPLPHSARCCPHHTCHRRERPTFLQQPHRSVAPPLQLHRRPTWSHAGSIHHQEVSFYYLCNGQ